MARMCAGAQGTDEYPAACQILSSANQRGRQPPRHLPDSAEENLPQAWPLALAAPQGRLYSQGPRDAAELLRCCLACRTLGRLGLKKLWSCTGMGEATSCFPKTRQGRMKILPAFWVLTTLHEFFHPGTLDCGNGHVLAVVGWMHIIRAGQDGILPPSAKHCYAGTRTIFV